MAFSVLTGVFASVAVAVLSFSIFTISLYADIYEDNEGASFMDSFHFEDKVDKLIEGGKFDEAITISKAHIGKNPNDEQGYWYLGTAYYLKKDWNNTIKAMNKVEELAPDWKERWVTPYRDASKFSLSNNEN